MTYTCRTEGPGQAGLQMPLCCLMGGDAEGSPAARLPVACVSWFRWTVLGCVLPANSSGPAFPTFNLSLEEKKHTRAQQTHKPITQGEKLKEKGDQSLL